MGNLRFFERFAITDVVLPLNVEHHGSERSTIVQLRPIVGRTRVLADELAFLDVIGFLADRLLS